MNKNKTKKIIKISATIALVIAMLFPVAIGTTKAAKKKKTTKTTVIDYSPIIKTKDGNFKLDSTDIIRKSTQLLGTKYKLGSKGGNAYGNGKVYTATKTRKYGVDCSGLVWWTLSSLKKDGTIKTGTKGFSANKPFPIDAVNWITSPKYQYWKEIGSRGGSALIRKAKLTLNGQSINVLKMNEKVADKHWYKYDGDKDIPSGTIIVSYNSKTATSKNAYNHVWIALGNFGAISEKEVAKILVNQYGVDASLLIEKGGNINGEFEIKKAYSAKKGKNVPVIQKTSDSSPYWRIESSGPEGIVYINNGDPTTENKDSKNYNYIWAFQIANSK